MCLYSFGYVHLFKLLNTCIATVRLSTYSTPELNIILIPAMQLVSIVLATDLK